jgi:vacuolar protein sorting-associated protein 54
MLRDVEHLIGKLGKVEGFGDLGTYLMKIIEGKEIKKVAPPVDTKPAEEEKPAVKEQEEVKDDESAKPAAEDK